MKAIIAGISIAIVMFFSASRAFAAGTATAEAASRSLSLIGGVGGGYYYFSPKDTQIQNYYRGGLTYQTYLEFMSESGFSVRADLGYFSEGNRGGGAPYGTSLTIIPLTASAAYHFNQMSAISPFIGAGVGIYNINESDPDVNYLKAAAFGKHIFAGVDLRFSADTILRAEVRDSFIDPVSGTFYYQANFGGLTALVSLAIDIPIFGSEAQMSPEERALARQERAYELALQDRINRLNEMEYYYRQQQWDAWAYRRWHNREYLLNQIAQTKEQIESDKAQAEQLKKEREEKRRQYMEEKLKLRQQKKDTVNPR